MPPKQCPECGRFLRNDFVQALTAAPAPCPRCGTELTPALIGMDDEASDVPVSPATPSDAPAVAEAIEASAASVRPPDVDASAVATEADELLVDVTDEAMSVRPPDAGDVLSGWDPDGYVPDTLDDARARDRTPQLAAIGAAIGFLAGLAFPSGRRGKGALLGGLVGALAGFATARLAGDDL